MYDVIIVGAGPGGSFTAKLLAKAGYDVILIEKDTIPRDKPCAGWISPKVLELTRLSTAKLETFAPMHGAVLWLPEKETITPYVVKYRTPVSYGIRRIDFDTLLTDDAKDAGAEVVDSSFVTNIQREKDGIFVQAKNNQEFKGKFIIGADGTHSTVAKTLGLRRKWDPSELIQCVVTETDVGNKIQDLTEYYGFPEVFFNFKAAGYSWFYSKSTFVNIGLGMQLSKVSSKLNVKILYKELMQILNQINHLQGTKLNPIKGHTYPTIYGPYHYPTYGDRVILIGDAGGFPINHSGEGIRTALLTGKFAAETVINALEEGHKNLKAYRIKWNRALRDEFLVGDVLQMVFQPSYYEMIKYLFVEEKRFRKLFFDMFFNKKSTRQGLRQFLLYSPLLAARFLRFTTRSLIKDFLGFLNV